MSDWDRYASDQYEILQAEEAYEQENEYVRSFSLPSLDPSFSPFPPSLPPFPPSLQLFSTVCYSLSPYLPG